MKNSAIHLAHLFADAAWQKYAEQVSQRQLWFDDEAILPATYQGFDGDTGKHKVNVLSEEAAIRAETNGGMREGEPVEYVDGVVDSMPRPREDKSRPERKAITTPKLAALVQKTALKGVRTIFWGGSAEIIKPASAAIYGIAYYHAEEPPPSNWVGVGEEPRYTFVLDQPWSGPTPSSDRVYNENRNPYCWQNRGDWQQAPRNIVRSSGYNYETQFGSDNLVYGWLLRSNTNPSGYDIGGGAVLIHLQPAADGVSAAPGEPNVPLPKLYWKIPNPDYPQDSNLSIYGQKYLGCDFSGGSNPPGYPTGGDALTALYYDWRPLEVFLFEPYEPEEVLQEAIPPQVLQVPEYEVQYWVFTESDRPKQLPFTTATITGGGFILPPDGSFIYRDSTIVVDDSGSIHVSIEVSIQGTGNKSYAHFLDGEPVDEPTSWRARYSDDFERDESIPNSCHRDYQNFNGINLNDDGDRLFQLNKPDIGINDILNGIELEIWGFDIITDTTAPTDQNITVCEVNLNQAPNLTEPITLPAITPDLFTINGGVYPESASLLTYAAQILE